MNKSSFLKGITVGIIVSLMFTGTMVYASTTSINVIFKNLKYMIDGVEKVPESGQGFIYEGTTYVPLRFIGESLGKEVTWDGKNSTIWIGEKMGDFTYLSDIEYARADGEAKDYLRFDEWKNYNNKKFIIAQNEYLHGLGQYFSYYGEEASVDYNLNAKYSRLTAFVGIDDNTKNSDAIGTVRFIADGKEVLVIDDLKGGDLPRNIDLDLTNVLKLQIQFKSSSYDELTIVLGEAKLIQ